MRVYNIVYITLIQKNCNATTTLNNSDISFRVILYVNQ